MLSGMFLFLSMQDTVVILIVALVLFGGKKLPELARGLGQGIREFKDASEGVKRDIQDQINKEVERKEPVAPASTDATHTDAANHQRETPIQ
jgi:sec-independent protein translocase protein TatA